ncbi:calcium-binding protein [Rhizobium sp. CG5]|uniref:calcium-binding protein n=1 Tax=Rhizobium sp. CG5 TaxID=2726076 RepID=UPI002033FD6E|nr:calcium-binding protein [Rhizobium sp. CG5]MCM2474052.1 calcium-binding protein [Rhizobium sp. CG5]
MATEIVGTNSNNTIRQSNYSSREVDIYAYGGNDTIYLDVGGSYGGFNYVEAGTGADRVYNYFEGGNRIYLEDGNDVYFGEGFSTATNYVDEVWAGYGNDSIQVSTYQSIYNGEAGNDSFFSVGWNNTFHGGSGTDMISYETQDDDADLSGTGVYIDLGNQIAYATNEEEETLISIENAVGTGYNDTVRGSSGANSLWGDAGVDLVRGFSGNDKLYGGSGNDKLYGDAGNDRLYGNSGRDFQQGGTGADTFYFNSINDSRAGSASRDTIDDFYRSEDDRINLSAIDANSGVSGNQSFDFIGTAAYSNDSAGELRFKDGILSGDINGDRTSDFQVAISDLTRMYASDFIL